MKRLLLIIACLPWVVGALANPVTADQARQKAAQFFNKRATKHARAKAPAAKALKMMAAGKDDSYYIFNVGDDGGYVVVSGEDATEEILGYSDTGSINPDNMPCGMRALFEGYTEQIKFLQKKGITTAAPRKTRTAYHVAESRLARYGQGDPYNDLCPKYWSFDFPNPKSPCPTGCAATAMAQLMYAYQWPKTTTNTITAYETESNGYDIDEIEAGSTIDWSLIAQRYHDGGSYSKAQKNEIARLMLMAGAATRMDYDSDGSTASGVSIAYALKQYFGYSTDIKFVQSAYTNSVSWTETICKELQKGYPVLYRGEKEKQDNGRDGGSHFFMLEGYDENGYFDVNFGREGETSETNNLGSFLLFVNEELDGPLLEYHVGQAAILDVTPRTDGATPATPAYLWPLYPTVTDHNVYQRSAESRMFENVKLTWNCVNNITRDNLVFDYGIEVTKNGVRQGDVIPVGSSTAFPFSLNDNSIDMTFTCGADWADGYYQLHFVSKENGTSEWIHSDNFNGVYAQAWVYGNMMTIRSTDKDNSSLSANNIRVTCEGQLRTEKVADISFEVANNGEDYDGALMVMLSWQDSEGTTCYRALGIFETNLAKGNTMAAAITWVPENAGQQRLVVYNKYWNEIGAMDVDILAADASLNMLEVTNLTLLDGDLDKQLIDGTMLRGKITLKNHDEVTNKSSIVIRLLDVDTQQYKYNTISVNIDPEQTMTYNFRFSNLTDGHAYVLSAMYMDNEEFYHSLQLNCTTEGMGEVEPGNEDLVAYEYWFDDNVANLNSIDLNSNDAVVRASINTNGLSYGLHRFNFRVKRSDGKYSPVTSSAFFKHNKAEGGQIVYWFDDNDIDTKAGSTSILEIEEPQLVTLDLGDNSKFPLGFHTLKMRMATRGKSLGSIFTAHVLKTATGDFDRIEYWVDDKFPSQASQRGYVTASSSNGKEFSFENKTFNLSGVASGPHRVYYRAVSSSGTTGSAVGMASVFVGGGTPSMIEYWFDDDATKSATVPLPASALQDTVDVALVMSDAEKFPLGFHQLNMRMVTDSREQSPLYTARVLKTSSGKADRIEYWVDDWVNSDGERSKVRTVTGHVASSDDNSYIFTDPFDLSDVSAGLHCLYYRAASSKGLTNSAVSMMPVLVGGGSISKLEYWFDGENSSDVRVLSANTGSDGVTYFNQTINLDDLSSGVHRLFYRGVNDEGESRTAVSMTPVLVKSMFKTTGDAVLSTFIIKVDNTTVELGPLNGEDEQLFTYTLDATELPLGNHTLTASFWNSYGIGITEQIPFLVVERPAYIKGDVNGDGDVDIADAVCIVNYVVGKSNTIFIEAADVNDDGDVDIADAVKIVNYVVGKVSALTRPAMRVKNKKGPL